MTLTPIDRQATALAEWERNGLERDAQLLARSGMVPEHFRGKPDDILIAGLALRDLGVRLSVATLGMVYVIKGRPGFMAQLQISLARLHGIDIRYDQSVCDEKSATVEIRDRTGWHAVRFTMADAVRARLPDSNPTYKTYPDRMLLARAVTKAVGMYAPEVKLGLADEQLAPDMIVSEPGPLGEEATAGADPPPLGSAPAAGFVRDLLRRVIGDLSSSQRLWLVGEIAKVHLRKIGDPAFSDADAQLLADLAARAARWTEVEPGGTGEAEDAGPVVKAGPATNDDGYAPGEEPFD